MSAPVRFLVVLAAGWVTARAVTLGAVPGFTVSHAKPAPTSGLPPIAATYFEPPPPPVSGAVSIQDPYGFPQAWASPGPQAIPYYVRYPAASYAPTAELPRQPIAPRAAWSLPADSGRPAFFEPITPLDRWEVSSFAAFPERRSRPVARMHSQSPGERLDRLQMSSWALLRGPPSPGGLASGGTLGGSQAGARLTYAFDRRIAASLRATSPVGGSRGAEVAAGIRFAPFPSIPVAITAERRQAISPHGGGRSAFALFAEGGLYRRPMPLDFTLDAYFQAGVVGFRRRDLFADGALAFTRPVHGRFSAGFGIWGGVQPGVYRVDAGPRLSIRVRDNIHAHIDWRQRLAGSAQPASGPALTLAADF